MNPFTHMTIQSWFDAQQAVSRLSAEAADSAAERTRHAGELAEISWKTWSDLSTAVAQTWVTALTPSR